MTLTTNLINIAKGAEHSCFFRTKLQKEARTSVINQFKENLEKIKGELLQHHDGFALVNNNATEAAEALANVHPPMSPDVFTAAAQENDTAQTALKNFETNAASTDLGLTALNRLKIKRKLGLNPAGNEFARIKSVAVLGEKHPVVKANLPVRGTQPVGSYVDNAHTTAQNYIQALDTRSSYVSPRLAAQGKDINASVSKYNEALASFTHKAEDDMLTKADVLADNAVAVKVLQNGKFRIQVRNNSDVGNLTAKIKLGQQSMHQHIQEGLTKAERLMEATEKDRTSHLISTKMFRNNFVQKQVDFKALDQFEAAKNTLGEEFEQIQELERKGVFVKVLRDGAFRITRMNSEGVVVKTRTIPLVRHMDSSAHVLNGLNQAEKLSQMPLPEKISTKQQLKNKFQPFKKSVLNFLG
jgi:hypothetical protein